MQQLSPKIKALISLLLILGIIAIGLIIFISNHDIDRRQAVNFAENPPERHQAIITIANHQIKADVMTLIADQRRGLGGVKFLADDQGMIFPYDPPATPGFWMKDMLIPIDIIWISNGRIIAIDAAVPTVSVGQELPVYRPPEPVTAVLEVAAGLSARKGFQVGDEVIIK